MTKLTKLTALFLIITCFTAFGPYQPPAEAEVWSLDAIATTIAGFGVSGGVFYAVLITLGPATGGVILGALALLGGPFGAIGGLVSLGLIVVVTKALAEYGVKTVSVHVFRKLREKGVSRRDIVRQVRDIPSFLLSTNTKARIIYQIEH